jgi:hypothetical protein
MLFVNNEKIETYTLDTRKSIISRIAAQFETLPRYLYFDSDQLEGKINIEDNLKKIIESAKTADSDFFVFLENNKKYFSSEINIKKDILHVWLSYNKSAEEFISYGGLALDQYSEIFVQNNYFDTVGEFRSFWEEEKPLVIKLLEYEINNNITDNRDFVQVYKLLENTEEIISTSFKSEKILLDILLDVKNTSILEIFNNIILNSNIPFVSCKKYYKILKDFTPTDLWKKTSDNEIILKLNEKVNNAEEFTDYTDLKIINEEKNIKLHLKLNTTKGFISQNIFSERFLSIFPNNNINFSKVEEKEIIGIFYFPMQLLNTYVFSDLVMNDSLFSSMIDIDESSKATKRKSNNQNWLYIHFNHLNTGHVSASIIQKFLDKTENEAKENLDVLDEGDPYIRIRAKATDITSMEIFKSILSKLLTIYDEKYNSIVSFYKKYIKDFGIVQKIQHEKKRKRSDNLDFDVFAKNYSRYCGGARIPINIEKEDVKKYEKKDMQVMLFPRDKPKDENEITYPSDGLNQKYYICQDPQHPYPGLQKNKLSNSKEYPFVPCCFTIDQEAKKTSYFRQYYFGERIENVEKKQQDLIITNKILGPEKYGTLNNKLDNFFNILEIDPDYKYIRVGVDRNYSSFLNCVMFALDDVTKIAEFEDEDERLSALNNIRIQLSHEDYASLAKQTCFNKTVDEISDDIKNPNKYLDPKLYIQVLEKYFKCKIFLFDTEKMIKPKYIQNYIQYEDKNPIIFIYEHMGGEADRSKYPQCEIIIRWNINAKDDTQFTFDEKDDISQKINRIFTLMTNSFSFNRNIKPYKLPFSDPSIYYISKSVDSYGKVRSFNLQVGDSNITIFTEPLPPLELKISDEIFLCSTKTALKFLETIGEEIKYQVTDDDKINEIVFTKNKLNYNILVRPRSILENVVIDNSKRKNINTDIESKILLFNYNKKTARYISEYILWLFSHFINDNNIDAISDKTFNKFQQKQLIVKDDYNYGNISKIFSKNNKLFEGEKLIILSDEMLKRLLYMLRLYSVRNMKELRTYYTKESITNYYVDISDFDLWGNQFVLQGEDSIDKIINDNEVSYKLNNEIKIGTNSPYFFQNLLISKKIFLAQNVSNINDAFKIYEIWQKYEYNIGRFPLEENVIKIPFQLYTYVDSKNIEKHNYGNGESNMKVIGYKILENSYFTILLEL